MGTRDGKHEEHLAKRGSKHSAGNSAQQLERRPADHPAKRGQKRPPKRHALDLSFVSLAVLLLITFFTSLYMRSLNSGIPYYYDSLGYSATVGGTFVAVFTLASMAMRLIGGQITDRFPHYTVLLASLGGLLAGVALPLVSSEFWVMMVSRVLQGASFALATNVMTVAVMDSAPVEHIGRRVGIKGVGTSLGTMLGAVMATWLLDGFGFQAFFGFYVVLMLASLVIVFLLKRADKDEAKRAGAAASSADSSQERAGAKPALAEASDDGESHVCERNGDRERENDRDHNGDRVRNCDRDHNRNSKRSLKNLLAPYLFPQMMPFMAISFVQRMPQGFCIAFILIFTKHQGIAAGAAFFVAAGAATLLIRLFGGNLFDSGKKWLLFPILCVEVLGFAALAISPSFATLLVAALGYGISVGGSAPFLKTIGAKSTPKEHWGAVNGELYFFGDIGKSVGAFFGGVAIDALGKAFVPQVALAIAVITAAVAGLSLLASRRVRAA